MDVHSDGPFTVGQAASAAITALSASHEHARHFRAMLHDAQRIEALLRQTLAHFAALAPHQAALRTEADALALHGAAGVPLDATKAAAYVLSVDEQMQQYAALAENAAHLAYGLVERIGQAAAAGEAQTAAQRQAQQAADASRIAAAAGPLDGGGL